MPDATNCDLAQARQVIRKSITIPANGSTAQTLADLASLTQDEQDRCIGFRILAWLAAGTTRPALVCGDAVGSMTQYIADGDVYYEPARDDDKLTFFKASGGSTIAATAVLYMI